MLRQQPKLFQDPKIVYPIHNLDLDFVDYIRLSKIIVKDTRQDLELNGEFIVDSNSPFEMLPPPSKTKVKYGALLIHGLLDSPFLMRDIGYSLHKHNMLIRAICLPGHGTVPGALLNVSYLDWLQAVRYGVATLKNEVEKIIIIGYSTGAMLSLLHASLDPDMIDRIVMIAPSVKINSPFAPIANWYKAISWAWPRAAWLHVQDEIDYVKYCSIPLNSVYQVYLLAQAIKKFDHVALQKIPNFLIASEEDAIVATKDSVKMFRQQQNKQSRALIYSAKKLHFTDHRIRVRSSVYPDMHIENFSHICLPFSPNNVHYGQNGYFPEASHVNSRQFVYGEEDAIDRWIYRLRYQYGAMKTQHRRLSFNPDFDAMIKDIENFIFSGDTPHPATT